MCLYINTAILVCVNTHDDSSWVNYNRFLQCALAGREWLLCIPCSLLSDPLIYSWDHRVIVSHRERHFHVPPTSLAAECLQTRAAGHYTRKRSDIACVRCGEREGVGGHHRPWRHRLMIIYVWFMHHATCVLFTHSHHTCTCNAHVWQYWLLGSMQEKVRISLDAWQYFSSRASECFGVIRGVCSVLPEG